MTRKKITIPMTNGLPMEIVEDEWPYLAETPFVNFVNLAAHDGKEAYGMVRVRLHADGQMIVFGAVIRPFCRLQMGRLLDTGKDNAELLETIRAVAQDLGRPQLARLCIARLPPELTK